jgi:hypothetical protein
LPPQLPAGLLRSCGGSGDRQKSHHDLRPKGDGTYVVEFRTAWGAVLSISIQKSEAGVIRYFQERMPYGLFVPDIHADKLE